MEIPPPEPEGLEEALLPEANLRAFIFVVSIRDVQSESLGGANIHSSRWGLGGAVEVEGAVVELVRDRSRAAVWAADPGAGGREGP